MMEYQRLILSCLAGAGVSVAMTVLILWVRDHKDPARRDAELHHPPRPEKSRLGGVALAAAFAAVLLLLIALDGWQSISAEPRHGWEIAAAALAMFGLGLWDDLATLGVRRKLTGQLLIAAAACYLGIAIHQLQIPFTHHTIQLGFWSWPVTVFWLVALTNLINLIDGVDGLASGIGLMLMALLAYIGGGHLSLITAGLAGALLGFLWFNFPPPRIYLGGGGAYFLGFLAGCLAIAGSQKGAVVAALTAPLFVLALPILDVSLAILRRETQGLPWFRPDHNHLLHRLIAWGITQRQLVLGIYAVTAVLLVAGFAAFWLQGQHLATLLGAGLMAILLAGGQLNFTREWAAVGHMLGNSLALRTEIQYALAQTGWLAMEGRRCEKLGDLCEDTVFIARKLGCAAVRIRLEDEERSWQLAPVDEKNSGTLRHELPINRDCFLELTLPGQPAVVPETAASGAFKTAGNKPSRITGELLAEGWARAVAAWKKRNQLPIRFDAKDAPAIQSRDDKIRAAENALAGLDKIEPWTKIE